MMVEDNIPYIPECEILSENGSGAEQLFACCEKNPGHQNFYQVDKIKLNHLPKEYRSEKVLKNIKRFCDRTVRISVNYTSVKRPDTYPNNPYAYPYSKLKGSSRVTRCGTGFIEYGVPSVTKGKPCPCKLCKASGEPEMEYLEVKVQTATHVVFDDSEAEQTICELFYDSENDRAKVKVLYGVSGRGGGARFGAGGFAPPAASAYGVNDCDGKFEKCTRDKFTIQCVTHDKELFKILPVMYNRQEYGRIPTMIISHPHGLCKRITFGNILSHTCPLPFDFEPSVSKYTVGRDVKFRMSEEPPESSRDGRPSSIDNPENQSAFLTKESIQFQHLLNSEELCIPGVEYEIKKKMVLTLPPEATYFCRCPPCDGDYDPCSENVEFPPGTRFTYGDDPESFPLPNGVKFNVEADREHFGLEKFPYHLIYDIATCPGSSGALVVDENYMDFRLTWVHSGALPMKELKLNKSGCYFSVYSMGWC